MTAPTNIFIRDTLSDNGDIPNTGGVNVSPDIIPQQKAVNPGDVQTEFGSATYSQDLGQQIEFGQSNYIYSRAKNPTGNTLEATLTIYYAAAGMFQHPSQWEKNKIGSGQLLSIPANSVLAAPEPDIWKPEQMPTIGHYCLIGVLTGNGLPTVPGSFSTAEAWYQFCRDNNIVAQRNIEIVDDDPGKQMERYVALFNPEQGSLNYVIEAICNVPQSSTVSLYCASNALTPPIDTGNISITGTNNNQIVPSKPGTTVVPGGFQGNLQIVFIPASGAAAGNYSIILKQYLNSVGPDNLLGSYTFEIKLS